MATLEELFTAAGVEAPTAAAVSALLRGAVIRDLVYLTDEEYETIIDQARIPAPLRGAADEGPPELVPISAIDRSRLRQVRAQARGEAGLPGERALVPAAMASSALVPATTPASKRVKLSSLVDPTAEAELVPLTSLALREMFARYEEDRGGPPGVEVEPTLEQLSAVKQLVDAGSPPYVDFSLFGPHGRRFMRRLTYIESMYQVSSGTWVRRELPGPDNFEAWERSWAVFECSCILLRIVAPERLTAYLGRIRKFVTLYGPSAWPIIYQADVRMRSEQFERLRRQAEIAQDPLLEPGRPWNHIFHKAVNDSIFWAEEVQEKAILLLARAAPLGRLTADGTLTDGPPSYTNRSHDRGTGGPVSGAKPAPRPQNTGGGKKKQKSSGKPNHQAPSGIDICQNWNRGKCPKTPCPNKRAHICSHCRSPDHSLLTCPTAPKKGSQGGGKHR